VVLPNGSFGTGFLISPSFFITNNHVIDSRELSLKAKFEFNYQTDINNNTLQAETYFASPDFFYTNDRYDLDYTIIKLKDHPGKKFGYIPLFDNESRPTAFSDQLMPMEFSPESVVGKDNAMILQIIQHPSHRYKEVVLHDCTFSGAFEGLKYFRYTCDTELDSSGSPVFDKYWRLFALHHGHGNVTWDPVAFKEIYLDNEGVSAISIVDDIMAHNMTKEITLDMKNMTVFRTG
jgi:V8-like Glu-specific endopeptidase